MKQRMTRKPILLPLAFVFFSACGGGDEEPPPPIESAPKVTTEIVCADTNLTAALDKCKSKILQALPAILKAEDQGSAMAIALAAGSAAEKEQQSEVQKAEAARQAQIQQAQQKAAQEAQKSQAAAAAGGQGGGGQPQPPAVNVSAECKKPIQDPKTSCNDDITTALLLWKSAHESDGKLAIEDPYYRDYLFKRMKDYLKEAGSQVQSQYGLTGTQLQALGTQLQGVFTNYASSGAALGADDLSKMNAYLPSSRGQTRIPSAVASSPAVDPVPASGEIVGTAELMRAKSR